MCSSVTLQNEIKELNGGTVCLWERQITWDVVQSVSKCGGFFFNVQQNAPPPQGDRQFTELCSVSKFGNCGGEGIPGTQRGNAGAQIPS